MALNIPNTILDKVVTKDNDKAFYSSPENNWFVAQPYGFKFVFSNNKQYVAFLPISPSNLTITTNFATNMVPTLYGTVEEHSDVRYFDIAIEGTTGIAPKYYGVASFNTRPGVEPTQIAAKLMSTLDYGRQSFSITKSIPLGGFFSKTLGTLNQAKNQALQVIDGSQKRNDTGIDSATTGYTAFHTLYKMLLRYKKDASGTPITGGTDPKALLNKLTSSAGSQSERKVHPIVFFNYKDGNQYNVVIRNFTMRRSADNPMLYYYSITMRGYSLTSVKGSLPVDNQQQRLKDLGLDGVSGSSFLGNIKKRANAAKGVLGSAVGGIKTLGR